MAFGHLVPGAESQLRGWLQSAELRPGIRLPSERALAEQLGINHYALNRAMARLIAEGLVERHGYKLFLAQKQQPLSSFRCELVLSSGSSLLPSYRKVAKDLGIQLRTHLWHSNEEAVSVLHGLESEAPESVVFDPPAGCSVSMWEPAVHRLLRRGVPVVCLGQPARDCACVVNDLLHAMKLAFEHLTGLGHRELALVTASPWSPASIEVLEAWKAMCEKNGLRASTKRALFQDNSRILREDAREAASRFSKDWSGVTALLVFTNSETGLHYLLEELARRRRRVPEDLSLLFLQDSDTLQTFTPTVSATAFDTPGMQEIAFRMAQRIARKKQEVGLLPPPLPIRIQPRLVLRASTGPANSTGQAPSQKERRNKPSLLQSLDQRGPSELEFCLKRAYPLAARAGEDRFVRVDLTRYVNRPLNFRRGWLGDLPLKHLAPGRHHIHGVPFDVLGGSARSDCGVIVFHSATNATGKSHKLPVKLKIPIGQKAAAVYILHGCGYAKFLQRFADYSFFNGNKMLAATSLVSLGQPPPDFGTKEAESANIQDWWPDFPHLDFPHARMAPVLENESQNATQWHAYLYTLEWVNPSPRSEVSHLEITVDPAQSTTLGVLAVSVLLPPLRWARKKTSGIGEFA